MNHISRLTTLFIILLTLSSPIKAENNNALAYSIKGEKNTVYLLGSIHLGHRDFYPFSDSIEEAFNTSPYLVVEVDITSPENLAQVGKMAEYAALEDGVTLEDLLSEDLYAELNMILMKHNLHIEYFKSYKPWFLTILLPGLQFAESGYSDEYGVDLYFLRKAQAKKEILELETFWGQIEMLENLNDILYLEYTIVTLDETGMQAEALVQAWREGDEEALEELLFSDLEEGVFLLADIYETIYFERNRAMFKKIRSFLKGNRDYFVVVGAGHLIGEEGIVELLENEGLAVERL